MRHLRPVGRAALAGITLAAVALFGAGAASAGPAADESVAIRGAGAPGTIKDSYIVVLKDTAVVAAGVDAGARRLTASVGGSVSATYRTTFRGFAATMTEAAARRLAGSPEVAYVEQDRQVTKSDIQYDVPSWGLDRLDQTFAPLNKRYTYPGTAGNVTAYVLDTGIRISHADFEGRASYGYDTYDDDPVADDCHGHGTHVAGTIGGRSHGVAKGVKLVAVRVLNCNGQGSGSRLIAGIEWVNAHAVKPAVVNLSLSTLPMYTLDKALEASIASGLTYTVAAGNDSRHACDFSPGKVPAAITVGATDEADFVYSQSNYGHCVDLFAPGHQITSADAAGDTATAKRSGTSMAGAHVAGAAALALSANPGWTPAQVRNHLVYGGGRRVVRNEMTGHMRGTPDVMLRVGTNVIPQVTGLRSLTNGRNVSAGARGATPLRPTTELRTVGEPEKFTVTSAGAGYVTLASWANGRYVSATSAGAGPLVAEASTVTDAERFAPVLNGDGTVSLLSKVNGRYVTAPDGGASPLVASATAIGVAEKFLWASPPAVVAFRAVVNGKLVTTPNLGADPLIASATNATPTRSEKFDMLPIGDSGVYFRAHSNGRFVVGPYVGNDTREPLIARAAVPETVGDFMYHHYGDGTMNFRAYVGALWLQAPDGGNAPLIANYDLRVSPRADNMLFTYEVLTVG